MNRRTLIAAVPALTGLTFFARFSPFAFAQNSYGVFAQANAAYNNSNPTTASALTSALSYVASSSVRGGQVASYSIVTSFSNAYNNWIDSLDSSGFFSSLDAAISNYPQAVISTPITAQALSPAVQLAKQLGFTTQSAQNIASSWTAYQTGLSRNSVIQIAKSGSRGYFVNAGSVLQEIYSGDPVSVFPAPTGGGTLNPLKSTDCDLFFSLGVVAALSGNEVCAAVCAIYCYANC